MFQCRTRLTAAAVVLACCYPLAASAQTGPVAAYSFSEASGSAAGDATGGGNNGAITGATWNAAGKFGSALSFNGSSNWVTINSATAVNLTSAMTLEAWVKPAALTNWRTVLLKQSTTSLSYALYAGDLAGHPAGYIKRTSDVELTSTATLPLNAWSHLALTYDGATLRLFINGVQSSSRAATGSIVTSTGPLRIGGNSVWGEYFNGLIDEVRIYKRALTATEIQTDMATPIAAPAPTWTLGGAVTPAADGSGTIVALSGAATRSTTADTNGAFSFANLPAGSYVVTPTKSGFTMAPANQAVTITTANVTGVNFVATAVPGGDTTPPTVAMSAPAAGATVFSSTTLSATASDNVGVAGVQFQLDGTNLIPEIVTPPYHLAWNTTLVADGPHTLRAVARDAAGNTTISAAISVTVSNSSNPAVVGQWGSAFDIGIVAVNMVLMHTGKVLMFSGEFATGDTERVWDPATGAITLVPNPYYNLFCAGQAQLPDGRILVAGGYDPGSLGAPNANIFDPVALSWTALPNMAYRRWYPTVTTLPNGKMLVMSGGTTCLTCLVDTPELFDPATNLFTRLTNSRLAAPYYPFMYVLPDGRVIDAGANERAFETHVLDMTTGAWTMIDPVVKDGHSSVMYRPGKILKMGTATDSGYPGNAAATAYVLDMTQPGATWRQVASMAFPRAFLNSTILPDGTVLVTGGGTALDGYDVSKGVRAAELWNPATETWTTLSNAAFARLYHSTTLLLPDGRLLIAGSGNDGPAINNRQGELYSPPYLFKGPRPTFTGAPAVLQFGSPFTIQSPDAASIASIALVRPGSVTHAFDQDQRYVPLTFSVSGNTVTVQAPANANLAPPGYYLLFVVNSAGVPSVAPFVRLPGPGGDTTPPTAPQNLTGEGGVGNATLTWTGSTDSTGVAVYNVHRATVSGFIPTVANRVAQPTTTSFTDPSIAPGTYYYIVTAQDVAGNVSAPSNEAALTVLADTTPPSVAIVSPANGASVVGQITISANANDGGGFVAVQFKLDGAPLGAEDVAAPFSLSWNSATVVNGPHTIAAVARDAAGNTTQVSVLIDVANVTQAPTGLVAAFSFDEGSGQTAADLSGSGNNGTLASSAAWSASGRTGAALSFAANGWVDVPDAPTLDLTTGMTIEAWVRPTSGTGWRTVILKESSGGLAYALYSANAASRPGVWKHSSGGDDSVIGTGAVPVNTWTHLAATFDGSTLRLYVNGVQVASKASAAAIAVSGSPLRIGGNGVWGEYFRGLIDDVRVYNKALTAAEIQTDMNTPVR